MGIKYLWFVLFTVATVRCIPGKRAEVGRDLLCHTNLYGKDRAHFLVFFACTGNVS